ncbi:MAG TPA: DNA alkylation repair protein [Paenibacillus sp.]|nr:DNA alkylation repair protein [Paenibacillus sp.]
MADALKDMYSRAFFEGLAHKVAEAYPPFEREAYLGRVFAPDWDELALKQRMRRGAEALRPGLPTAYEEALEVVLMAADRCGGGFPFMLFPDFVEVYGRDDPERSLTALARLTKYSSSEFAVRPYLIRYPELTLRRMLEWTESEDEHVRRLASEGCRPRLPWGMALAAFKRDPTPILPILERLKRDPSEYVRRSVANNLNDISKDHPGLALELASRWLGEHPHTDWIAKHACRSLLKKCVPEALALFGVGDSGGVSVERFAAERGVVEEGGALEASFVLRVASEEPRKLRVEYAIDYVKANGSTSRKLFKLSEREFAPGATAFRFRQSFRDMTTRKHYPGTHGAAIVVNGSELASISFEFGR